MSGHVLWVWEEDECLALRRALANYNASKPRAEHLIRRHLADELGVSLNTIGAYITGRKALNMDIAEAVHRLTGIPIQVFSPRLADEKKVLDDCKQIQSRSEA